MLTDHVRFPSMLDSSYDALQPTEEGLHTVFSGSLSATTQSVSSQSSVMVKQSFRLQYLSG